MPSSANLLKAARLTHLYLGVFAAPAILFFAFTGAIQTFSLHETTRGSSYQPPRILVILGQIHKKQTPVIATKKAGPSPDSAAASSTPKPTPALSSRSAADAPTSPTAAKAPTAPEAPKHNPLPLKIFFFLIAVSLFLSTLTGMYMSYKYVRNKLVITALIILGTVLPVLMILI